jgi:hypothetical protein
LIEQVRFFVEVERVPLIVCQSRKESGPLLGHFRVIVGIDEKEAVFHDPVPEVGKDVQWPIDKMMENWQQTGINVTGGVAIWIADRQLASPLGPHEPNPWPSPP